MNKNIIALLTFASSLFYFSSFGQQNISDLTANAKEASGELDAIYDLDVFSYFNLDDYDTDLKKEVFKKSAEYQNKLQELKTIKAEMLKTTYYTSLEEPFNSYNEYDIKRRGFDISLGENTGMGTISARTPKSLNISDWGSILLKALPSRQVPIPIYGKGFLEEKLFIPMDELSGLEVENDKEKATVYFFFVPCGKEKTTFRFYNNIEGSNGGWYNITRNDLKSDKVRIIVANKSTGKVLFDKSYSYQPKPTATKK